MTLLIRALALSLLAAIPAHAAEPAPVCRAPVVPGGEWVGWSAAQPLTAGAAARITPGQAVTLTLAPVGGVAWVASPAKAPDPASNGGMVTLAIATPGTYRLALGSAAWIDLIATSGASQRSIAHGHGPACTPIHKIVDFTLDAGVYTVQISGNAAPVTTLMVIRQP